MTLRRRTRPRLSVMVSSDALLDPQVLLEAVRASMGGSLTWFTVNSNQATCDHLRLSREELLGRGWWRPCRAS